MKKILATSLILFQLMGFNAFADSTEQVETDSKGIVLYEDGHASRININCADPKCAKVKITYGPPANVISKPTKASGSITVSFAEIRDWLDRQDVNRSFLTPDISIRELYDPYGGAYNAIVPIIWIFAYVLFIPRDAIELTINQKDRLLKIVNRVEKELIALQDGTKAIKFNGWGPQFDQLIELTEKGFLAYQRLEAFREIRETREKNQCHALANP